MSNANKPNFEARFLRVTNVRLRNGNRREDLCKVEAYEGADGTGIHVPTTFHSFLEQWEIVRAACYEIRLKYATTANVVLSPTTKVEFKHIEVDLIKGEVTLDSTESGPLEAVTEFTPVEGLEVFA